MLDRDRVLERLEKDLIGPFSDDELLESRPSDVYLTGILWPSGTELGGEDDDKLSSDSGDTEGPSGEEEQISPSGLMRPSTAGVSFAISGDQTTPPDIELRVSFATYKLVESSQNKDDKEGGGRPGVKWQRQAWKPEPVLVRCDKPSLLIDFPAKDAPRGVRVNVRSVRWSKGYLVTATLINDSRPAEQGRRGIEAVTLFQVELKVQPRGGTCLLPRPSRRTAIDEDDRSSALLYRNAYEFAVGHTCSASWVTDQEGMAESVRTAWVPQATVSATSSDGHKVFAALRKHPTLKPLDPLWLAEADDELLGQALIMLSEAYSRWIEEQEQRIGSLDESFRPQAMKNLDGCKTIRDRVVEGGRRIIQDKALGSSFRLANRAMAMQHGWDTEKSAKGPLSWRPFQLGFILLAAASVADETHADRGTMDLLWFPTGGGKTEAYLMLVALIAFYRRLSRKNPDEGAGVASIMRYTLRLLTTQQFIRAAAVTIACEAIRRGKVPIASPTKLLGSRPFSIGLWVGGEATPNKFEEADRSLAGAADVASPKQLLLCPACRQTVSWRSEPTSRRVLVCCENQKCIAWDASAPLPVWTVDEDVYRERPTLVIGTVDKFAQIVRRKEINGLFGLAEGNQPDLIIQDELHLISGPLGTIAGLYETAVDRMFRRETAGPKIVGSTATIRRAPEQVKTLFRRTTCQFPPPGIDHDDSGFAVSDPETPPRLYAAITTAGRSAKFTLQAVAATLLQSAQSAFPDDTVRDPYWTLVTYFNSLRELGGALVLMQDDVADAIRLYADRRAETPRRPKIIEELTSRRTQAEVRDMLAMLGTRAGQHGALDVVLATNMLSVGVDIPRLGLMVVNGQPKGIAEYIQATSRVGRLKVPGLIVSVLNNSKARDRSHYEAFKSWHGTLYRDVEATSVTPFASRARDRALHAVLVALARHLVPGLLDTPALDDSAVMEIETLISEIAKRAAEIDPDEQDVEKELKDKLRRWNIRQPRQYWNDYQTNQSLLQSAEHAATVRAAGGRIGDAWSTPNNMRNVEPGVPFRLAERLSKKKGANEKDNG